MPCTLPPLSPQKSLRGQLFPFLSPSLCWDPSIKYSTPSNYGLPTSVGRIQDCAKKQIDKQTKRVFTTAFRSPWLLSKWCFKLKSFQRFSSALWGTLWKKPFSFYFPSGNIFTKDWQSRCYTRTFLPPSTDLFYIPHDRNLFRSLEADILHSQMPEKASGPWNAIFYIPPCQKMLVPGARPGLPPGARILWHGGM